MVIEGPSGIGKTTTVTKVLSDLGINNNVLSLSARKKGDLEMIVELPDMGNIGTVIVDDFHRLPDAVKERLSDFMKVLADAQDEKSKLILIGINKAGQQLVKFAHDLGLRLDVFRLESNPIQKVEELITRGEEALNIEIAQKQELAERAQGSFQIAQLLAHKLCLLSRITETVSPKATVSTSLAVVVEDVMVELARQFKEATLVFARGSKLRKEGRAPYLHILRWLSEAEEWSLDLSEAMRANPQLQASIGQVIEKGHLEALLHHPEKAPILTPYFHYEPSTTVLSVEDPKLIFYLKNVVWRAFTRQVGFKTDFFPGKYDFALSFAGVNRDLAERLANRLTEREVSVFYDLNEQHNILARNVEDYLAPIYRSEAQYVIAIQSPEYPTRIWTKFESDQFKERFGTNSVIPIRLSTVKPGAFGQDDAVGRIDFNVEGDENAQLDRIADVLCERLKADRADAGDKEEDGEEE